MSQRSKGVSDWENTHLTTNFNLYLDFVSQSITNKLNTWNTITDQTWEVEQHKNWDEPP